MYDYRHRTPEEREELVQNRLARGYPPHQPPHPLHVAGVYLLTAACYEHARHMASPARRQDLLGLIQQQCQAREITLYAWVVLPNHYHLLADVPEMSALGELFRRAHGRTAHDWNEDDGAPGRRVWYRYSDRAMRSEAHFYAALNYVHANPVRHGWVASPYAWEESSVHWYLAQQGRSWLRDTWRAYPIGEMGAGWDEQGNR